MRSLSRKITAAFLTAALAIPATVGVSTAQSSFASLSSGSDTSTGNHGSKATRLENLVEQANIRAGHTKNADAERVAEELLDRALAGDIYYIDNVHESTTYNPLTQRGVVRIDVEYIDYLISEFEGYTPDTLITAPFGVAVGKDSNYYYLAEVFILR